MQANINDRFYTNNISIINNGAADALLYLSFIPPLHWKSISPNAELRVHPGETRVVPLSFSPLPAALSEWTPFEISVTNRETKLSTSYFFYVKALPVIYFNSNLFTRELFVNEQTKKADLRIYIRNLGNISSNTQIQLRNTLLELDRKITFKLGPGKDSVVNYTVKVQDHMFKKLKSEKIFIFVRDLNDTTGNRRAMTADISRVSSVLKQHESAFPLIPMVLESGLMKLDSNRAIYYGAVTGALEFEKKGRLNFFFRTREYNVRNQIAQNVFLVNYTGKRFDASAGVINDMRYFFSDGNGLKTTWRLKDSFSVTGSVNIHRRISLFKSNNFSLQTKYKWNKVWIGHAAAANFDTARHVNSYLFTNNIQIFNSQKLQFDVTAGGGWDDYKGPFSSIKTIPGFTLGYNFNYSFGKWQLISSVQHNDNNYPGLFKGIKTQQHDLKYTGKKGSVGIYWVSNFMTTNLFRDTIYNTTAFTINTSRYGLSANNYIKHVSVSYGIGQLQQKGFLQNTLASYTFGNFSINTKLFSSISLRASTMNGVGKMETRLNQVKNISIGNTNLTVYHKYAGINALLVNMPIINTAAGKNYFERYFRTLSITPYVSAKFFKRFNVTAGYTLSQSLLDTLVTSFVAAAVTYEGLHNGVSIITNADIPVIRSLAFGVGLQSQLIRITIRKKINMPFFLKRQYHNLKMIAFTDTDNNGLHNGNEQVIQNVALAVQDNILITNNQGMAVLKNISPGNYPVDFSKITNLKGFVPAAGNNMEVAVRKNKTEYIPFIKSKTMTGFVKTVNDTSDMNPFRSVGIKIIVSDTTGRIFSTLTDETGAFYFNLPSGRYVVSLNPEVFNDKIKPDILSYTVDLNAKETAEVEFVIRKEKRTIRFLKN
ncbi:MAG: hypothetical protein K2X48_16330 [Chitinophagaceae bacterium]|nr:hypothetical protein [Chitinophagaceae bacterium]